jgi:hypothetical protein
MTTDLSLFTFVRASHRWKVAPWVLVLAFAVCPGAYAIDAPLPAASTPATVPLLSFNDFFEASSQEPKLSKRLLALSGQRVKLVGFMAKMEIPPKGGFYLTALPVSCDEEGGGTADLPPRSVFVIVRSSVGEEIPHTPRALEVTGLLEVGYRVETDERVTHIRLLLDSPQDLLGTTPKH